jgi:hypothetical protein
MNRRKQRYIERLTWKAGDICVWCPRSQSWRQLGRNPSRRLPHAHNSGNEHMTKLTYLKSDLLSLATRLEQRGRTTLERNHHASDLIAAAKILQVLARHMPQPIANIEIDVDMNGRK